MEICSDFSINHDEAVPVAILFRQFLNLRVPVSVLREKTFLEVAKLMCLTEAETRFIYAAVCLRRSAYADNENASAWWKHDFEEVMGENNNEWY